MLYSGQTTIDTSDQPVYALSKRLQQMYPPTFGQGKYFPMFGRFHREKLLLDIHGQLIAGRGLPRFLN